MPLPEKPLQVKRQHSDDEDDDSPNSKRPPPISHDSKRPNTPTSEDQIPEHPVQISDKDIDNIRTKLAAMLSTLGEIPTEPTDA